MLNISENRVNVSQAGHSELVTLVETVILFSVSPLAPP